MENEIAKLEAEKLSAEVEKIRAEGRELGRPQYRRASFWAALIPGATAVATILIAWNSDFFDSQRILVEAEDARLSASRERIQSETALLEAEKLTLSTEVSTLETDRNALNQELISLSAEKAVLESGIEALMDENANLSARIGELEADAISMADDVRTAPFSKALSDIIQMAPSLYGDTGGEYLVQLLLAEKSPELEKQLLEAYETADELWTRSVLLVVIAEAKLIQNINEEFDTLFNEAVAENYGRREFWLNFSNAFDADSGQSISFRCDLVAKAAIKFLETEEFYGPFHAYSGCFDFWMSADVENEFAIEVAEGVIRQVYSRARPDILEAQYLSEYLLAWNVEVADFLFSKAVAKEPNGIFTNMQVQDYVAPDLFSNVDAVPGLRSVRPEDWQNHFLSNKKLDDPETLIQMLFGT